MELKIGEVIKRLRAERNITQQELADILGVSGQSVSRWENGVCYPDTELLPPVASFFGVSVDTLLGADIGRREQKINEYLELYESMRLKDFSAGYKEFEKAVAEFPGEYRLLVRYMELLFAEKDRYGDPDHEKTAEKIAGIYRRISAHCTDDGVRIWAKRIYCQHLVKRYECYGDRDAKRRADELLDTMPAMRDSAVYLKMCLSTGVEEHRASGSRAADELLYLLDNALAHIYYYAPEVPPEVKKDIILKFNELLLLIEPDAVSTKNGMHLVYNYGHLGHLYSELGDDRETLRYLRLAAETAARFDDTRETGEITARYYEREPTFRGMDMRTRIKNLMTEHYPLSGTVKNSPEFHSILELLDAGTV